MEKFIVINREAADIKNIYISEFGIQTSEINLETKENFLLTKAKETLNSINNISFYNIKSISTFKDDFGLQINYLKEMGGSSISYLEFDTFEELSEIKEYIVSRCGLRKIDIEKNSKDRIRNKFIITILLIIVMIIGYNFFLLPKFTLVIILLFSAGFLYWVKLAQVKSAIELEKYIRASGG